MVRLEGTIRRFIGRSTDRKPRPGVQQPDLGTISHDELLPGSSFLESDTARVYRWSGSEWIADETEDAHAALLGAILTELQTITERLTLMLADA